MEGKDNVIIVEFNRVNPMDRIADESAQELVAYFDDPKLRDDEVIVALLDSVRRAWEEHIRTRPRPTTTCFVKELEEYGRDCFDLFTP